MCFVLYFGHINYDVLIEVESFAEPGESKNIKRWKRRIGGTAYNAYKSMRALDIPVKVFSVIGNDFEERVDGYFVYDEKTPVCFIISKGSEQMAYVAQDLWLNENALHLDPKLLQKFEYLHFATGNPHFYLKLMREAKFTGKRIVFDPSQEIHYLYTKEIFSEMLQMADLFFCNSAEYDKATEFAGEVLKDKLIIRTEGENGASIHIPQKGWYHYPAYSVEVCDTVGAGDAFRAGFYAALYRGFDIETSIYYANAAASASVENDTGYITVGWKEIERRAKILQNLSERRRITLL